jgi:beta-glucosidase
MRAIVVLLLTGTVLLGCASQQELAFKSVEGKNHSAVTPVRRTDQWWVLRHDAVNERLQKRNVDLIFIGDSITQGWENKGKEIWDTYYATRNAVNMGFSGDRTQHVLWRLDHSNLEGICPKLAVLMIGTNNSNKDDNTAEEIADGIIAICKRLRTKLPKTKILMLAIFPRDPKPSAQRQKNARASLLASRIADGKMIYYLDINSSFLTENEILTKDVMPDYLHPNKAGYKIWAEAIEPKIAQLMGEHK